MQTITATYEDGVLKPAQPLDLAAHAQVRLTIELLPASPLTVGELNAFLCSLPALGDDAEEFAKDVRAVRRRYTFKQLMAGVMQENIHGEIKTGPAVGKEIL